MAVSGGILKIIQANKCPLYRLGDSFKLTGRAWSLPTGRAACLTLALDIQKALSVLKSSEPVEGFKFYCSGPSSKCVGVVKVGYRKIEQTEAQKTHQTEDMEEVINLLKGFSIFQSLNEEDIRDLVSALKLKKYAPGDTVIKKGEPGKSLYIVVSGRVEVMGDDEISFAYMEKGDVFGEMSLLSGDPVGATIQVSKPSQVLYMNGRDFSRTLRKYPALQMYFARLLARRLAKTNIVRSEEFASGMVGRLSEMPPSELFQALNINQKTGVLNLHLPKGVANVFFREGNLISARYDNKNGKDAFFEILKEKRGRFKFTPGLSPEQMGSEELGDFMWLLMEGVRRMDEEE